MEVIKNKGSISKSINDIISNRSVFQKGKCSWPVGDINESDFLFCNQDCSDDSPYCEKHRSKAYSKKSLL